MLKNNLKEVKLDSSVDLEEIVKNTDGYSGADIIVLCKQATFLPMRRRLKK